MNTRLRSALLLIVAVLVLAIGIPLLTWAGIEFWQFLTTPSGVGREHY